MVLANVITVATLRFFFHVSINLSKVNIEVTDSEFRSRKWSGALIDQGASPSTGEGPSPSREAPLSSPRSASEPSVEGGVGELRVPVWS